MGPDDEDEMVAPRSDGGVAHGVLDRSLRYAKTGTLGDPSKNGHRTELVRQSGMEARPSGGTTQRRQLTTPELLGGEGGI